MKQKLWVVMMLCCTSAMAGVGLDRTRLVFHAGHKSEQFAVNNTDSGVYLVQTQILAADSQTPSKDFLVMPPLFRLDAQAKNVVRVMRLSGNFPTDRETLRYLEVKALPATDKPFGQVSQASTVSIALATLIKLYYRPAFLQPEVTKSYGLLQASQTAGQLIIRNPTPYYQTFARLALDGRLMAFKQLPQMIAPFSEVRYPEQAAIKQIRWRLIDDFGGVTPEYQQSVKQVSQ